MDLRRASTIGLLAALSVIASARAPAQQEADAPEAEVAVPRLAADGTSVRFGARDAALLEYHLGADGLKAYVRRLVTPGGIELARDAPQDHEHHHGLMFALGVDDVDFWGERYAEVPGRQVGRLTGVGWSAPEEGRPWSWLSEEVSWLDPRDGAAMLVEARELRWHSAVEGEPLVLTWSSRLALARGREEAALWGRPYFGLGLRLAEAFDRVGRFTNADGLQGEVVRGDERLVPSRWCSYVADVAGTTVTVAMLDHPRNPRHPARFFTMAEPFAYMSATLDLQARPLELEGDETLDLTYGLAVWEERVGPERIEALFRAWAGEQDPTAAAEPDGAGPDEGG